MQIFCLDARMEGRTVGFVPTMGAFHEGHLSLMRRARERCDVVVVSLFVNPAQFGPAEDLSAYPRDLERDLEMAESAGVDALFTPTPEAMYGPGDATVVEVPLLSNRLCGLHRPGHFRGVSTVVAKLLALSLPHEAYFGQKDWQQLAIIRRMTVDLRFPTKIVGLPTVREPDGLAMSSRNVYLTPEERAQAPALHAGLRQLRGWTEESPRVDHLLARLRELWSRTLPDGRIDYVEIVDGASLESQTVVDQGSVALCAIRLGRARLIDNLQMAGRQPADSWQTTG